MQTQDVLRFDQVELRLARRELLVDGRPRPCSRKAFELLWALASHPRRARTRDELIEALWPGGQIISDEALTQVVFRARSVLGSYGSRITTIRGVGFALDADVTVATDAEAKPSPAAIRVAADEAVMAETLSAGGGDVSFAGRSSAAAPRRYVIVAFCGLLLALVAAAWIIRPFADRPTPPMDDGYGFTREDLQGHDPRTPALVAEALQREASGERERAVSLMQAVHETDPATPVPALMIALWTTGARDQNRNAQWLAQAQARIGPDASPMLRLFRDYVAAESALDAERVIATAGAILDLRPDAWRMRHARAHLMDYRGMRESALAELRQITFPALGHRRRDQIIADLASFGDPDAAERILERLQHDPERATWQLLSARLAWTRERWDEAAAILAVAAESARREGQPELEARILLYRGAALALLHRDAEAAAALEAARGRMSANNPIDALEVAVMLAGLRSALGQNSLAEGEWQRARALLPMVSRTDASLAAWLALLRSGALVAVEEGPELDADGPEQALWAAARGYQSDDLDVAREQLELAVERRIGDTRLRDEARWLQHRLGLTVAPALPLDPPYPPLSRVLLRRELAGEG